MQPLFASIASSMGASGAARVLGRQLRSPLPNLWRPTAGDVAVGRQLPASCRHFGDAVKPSESGVAAQRHKITLSPKMLKRATRNILQDIDLIVYDMAGTTVQEGGIVYKTLQQAMRDDGLDVSDEAMHPWHGAKKEAVIAHFATTLGGTPESQLEERVVRIGETFVKAIDDIYFDEASTIDHIDIGLLGYFRQLKEAGVKIALDTGYPQDIQNGLVKRLGFDKVVDGWISSYDVPEGRPYPYMIHRLCERLRIEDMRRVCKVGDSVRDIEEGHNAGCGLVVGVLSGADDYETLMRAGADVVCNRVTDLPVPTGRETAPLHRLPDFS